MKQLLGEFLTIVLGVLVALGVDEWRQDRAELEIAGEHLTDITAELRQNLCTVERVRVRQMSRKMKNLQTVLDFLNDPDAVVPDPAALLRAFAASTIAVWPWLVNNQYQALQNSGNVRLVQKLQPTLTLSGLYEGPNVLFSQVQRMQGAYPVVVNELMPAQLQAEVNPLRSYARGGGSTTLRDDPDLSEAVERIRARHEELLQLARNEAAVGTAREFILLRIRGDIEDKLVELERWDNDPMPIPEYLERCAEGKQFADVPAAGGNPGASAGPGPGGGS